MNEQSTTTIEARRKSARRTVLWLALLAVGIYAAFILAGVYGSGVGPK